ncbi:hypothetical protein B296_00053841 [Ensete ventricosum]|uniref:Uncharacterized protein n=1 Tax=Ensete ventricosum TaxID=4639 RepID=A0A426XGW9_ENSVE|nr:hypothetical protein B296_00053841 [Ensete ventricosum]
MKTCNALKHPHNCQPETTATDGQTRITSARTAETMASQDDDKCIPCCCSQMGSIQLGACAPTSPTAQPKDLTSSTSISTGFETREWEAMGDCIRAFMRGAKTESQKRKGKRESPTLHCLPRPPRAVFSSYPPGFRQSSAAAPVPAFILSIGIL